MGDRFPKDCWDKKCPHFKTRDMSIDDLLKLQCDACEEDFIYFICPLPEPPKIILRRIDNDYNSTSLQYV